MNLTIRSGATAMLAVAAITLGVAQPAAADESGYFDSLTGSVATTPGSVCLDSYLAPNTDVASVTLVVSIDGAEHDRVTSDVASSEFGWQADPIQYERCFDVAAGEVTLTALAQVTPAVGDGQQVLVPVVDKTMTVAAPTVPATPRAPSLSGSGKTAIKVKWAAVADGGRDLTGYQVRVYRGSSLVKTVTTGPNAKSASVSGLKLHSTYKVNVRASNAVGFSPASASASIKLEVPGRPAKPKVAAKGVSSVGVAWKAPASAGGPAITGYRVRVYQGSTAVKTVDVASDKRSVTVTGLKAHTKYSVVVGAKNSVGYSAASLKAPVTTKDWSAAAKWAAKKYGTFSTVTISGSGDDVIRLPKGAKSGIISASYSGSSNFIVEVQDAAGDMVDLPVNEIGTYKGVTLFGMDTWRGTPRQLAITASGKWKVQIRAVRTAGSLAGAGTGDGVYLYGGGARGLALTHSGSSNFIVATHDSSLYGGDLLVNKIGSYKGTVSIKKGPAVVEVVADGKWTARLK